MDFDKKMNVEMNGFIENGKQYDLEVKVPEDNRNVAFGMVKDEYGDPICDAVVKLIEVQKCLGKEDRKPVSHTFTNENGEFVFGPLCPDKNYELQIWVDRVKHVKICRIAKPRKAFCLRGEKIECKECDFDKPHKPEEKPDYDSDYKPEYKTGYKPDCKPDYKPEHKPECKKDYESEYKSDYKPEYKTDCKQDYKPEYEKSNHEKRDCGCR